jgi:hypothetical protein
MKIRRFTIKACCGGISIIYKTDQSLTKEHLAALVGLGFIETEQFTKAGILYVDNSDFIVTGPFGSDRLQVKCKHAECTDKLNNFEELLQQLG